MGTLATRHPALSPRASQLDPPSARAHTPADRRGEGRGGAEAAVGATALSERPPPHRRHGAVPDRRLALQRRPDRVRVRPHRVCRLGRRGRRRAAGAVRPVRHDRRDDRGSPPAARHDDRLGRDPRHGDVRDDGGRRARGLARDRGRPGRRRNNLLRRLRPLCERGDPTAGRRGRPLGREHSLRDRHEPQLRARPRPRRGPADTGVTLGGSRRQRAHVPDVRSVHGDDPWRPRPGGGAGGRCPDRGGRRDSDPEADRRASRAHVEPVRGRTRGDPGDDQRAVWHGDGAVRARVDGSAWDRGRRRRLPIRGDRRGRDRCSGDRAATLRTVGGRRHPGGLGGHVRTTHGDTRLHPRAERRDRRVVGRGCRDDRRRRDDSHLLATAARRGRARPGFRNA